MKGPRRYLRLLGLVLVTSLILVAAGCGTKAAAPAGGTAASNGNKGPSAADFYKGKNLTFIVPYSVGGGFDKYARLLAPYLEKSLGATVVVLNRPGAGGLVGANELYQAKPDGLTIGILNVPGMIYNKITGEPNAKYDLDKYTWLARVTAESRVTVVGKNTPFKTIKDFVTAGRPIKISFTGKGSDDYFSAAIAAKAFGFKIDSITGYGGSKEAELAVARGDVDGTQSTTSSIYPMIKQGDVRPLVQFALTKDPLVPGVPLASDVVGPEGKELVNIVTSIIQLDRTIAAPQGVPADRVKALRDALAKSLQDPQLVAATQKAMLPLSYLSGEETAKLVETVTAGTAKVKPIIEESMKATK